MGRRARRESYKRWDEPGSQTNMVAAYLVGVVGTAAVIALVVFAVTKVGWMDRMQTALRGVRAPSLPSLPHASVEDVFQGLGSTAGSTEQLTTTLWQRGGAKVGQATRGLQPGGAGRGK